MKNLLSASLYFCNESRHNKLGLIMLSVGLKNKLEFWMQLLYLIFY